MYEQGENEWSIPYETRKEWFNENPGSYFGSIDACGGIGLNVRYASGDLLGCCQSSTGINSSLPFILFVR